MKTNGFQKHERLYHRKVLDAVFKEGKTLKEYPMMLLYLPVSESREVPARCAVSVSKRNFKRAVHRNRIKRLMREVWRHQKNDVYTFLTEGNTQLAMVWLFVGKELPNHQLIARKITSLCQRLKEDIATFPPTNTNQEEL
ncbi:MAG: ribonuclease protein component [Bacteroidota bacterium]|jgi:ribonuclease P protein component